MSQTDDLKTQNSIAENLTKLCEWSVRLSIGDIPKEVLKHAALILGDNIAATISAANEPEVHAYHQQLMNSPQVAQATLLCQNGPQVSMMNAALGNGLAITWNELDDGYTKTAVHPGALSQPLILAAAQAPREGPLHLAAGRIGRRDAQRGAAPLAAQGRRHPGPARAPGGELSAVGVKG